MAVVTLTELNQHPSRVARLAESGPVHIHRYGRSYLVLHREDDPVEAMRAAGLIRPPTATGPLEFPDLGLSDDEAEALYADFEASRRLDA